MFKISKDYGTRILANYLSSKEILNMCHHATLFSQTLSLIPRHVFQKLEARHKTGRASRLFGFKEQFTVMAFIQLAARRSMRDGLRALMAAGKRLYHLGLKSVPRSTFADANNSRPVGFFQDLFAEMYSLCAQKAPKRLTENLFLIPGDVALSGYEDTLSEQWPNSMGDNSLYRPMRILSSFWQVMQAAAASKSADIILVDIGPNLGAINRSVLIATDCVVIPLGADLFSLQGLRNLGPTLRSWRSAWSKRLENWENSRDNKVYPDFKLPDGKMNVIGYLTRQHGVRLDRPVKAYDKWINRIPQEYRKWVLAQNPGKITSPEKDSYCLATIKHYRSLIPMGQEVRKPIFKLTSADGAIGSHAASVRDAENDFKSLARKIAAKAGLPL